VTISELHHARTHLGPLLVSKRGHAYQVDTQAALQVADETYASLDERLGNMQRQQIRQTNDSSDIYNPVFLLGSGSPSTVDALLFAHLAEALSDPHLQTLLPKHDHLMSFFRCMYSTYFGPTYRIPSSPFAQKSGLSQDQINGLLHLNNLANSVNAYNKMSNKIQSSSAIVDADHQLKNQTRLDATLRVKTAGQTLDRLVRGGRLFPEPDHEKVMSFSFFARRNKNENGSEQNNAKRGANDAGSGSSPEEREEKLKTERKRDDAFWMGSVAAAVLLAFTINSKG